MPYLGKLFGGGQRRRNNISATPRPSLAPTPQQSNATIPASTTAGMAVVPKNSISPVDVGYGGLVSNVNGTLQNDSTGVHAVPIQVATPTTSIAVAGAPRATSWWEFFGIHRTKKVTVSSPESN